MSRGSTVTPSNSLKQHGQRWYALAVQDYESESSATEYGGVSANQLVTVREARVSRL